MGTYVAPVLVCSVYACDLKNYFLAKNGTNTALKFDLFRQMQMELTCGDPGHSRHNQRPHHSGCPHLLL